VQGEAGGMDGVRVNVATNALGDIDLAGQLQR
jgi:hypothetical protein